MKVTEICEKLQLEVLALPSPDKKVKGVYSGDLLSWVMTRLSQDFVWVTIMSNINAVAVASLSDASCIIFSEKAEVGEEIIQKSISEGINLFRTDKSTFEICYSLGRMLYAE